MIRSNFAAVPRSVLGECSCCAHRIPIGEAFLYSSPFVYFLVLTEQGVRHHDRTGNFGRPAGEIAPMLTGLKLISLELKVRNNCERDVLAIGLKWLLQNLFNCIWQSMPPCRRKPGSFGALSFRTRRQDNRLTRMNKAVRGEGGDRRFSEKADQDLPQKTLNNTGGRQNRAAKRPGKKKPRISGAMT